MESAIDATTNQDASERKLGVYSIYSLARKTDEAKKELARLAKCEDEEVRDMARLSLVRLGLRVPPDASAGREEKLERPISRLEPDG